MRWSVAFRTGTDQPEAGSHGGTLAMFTRAPRARRAGGTYRGHPVGDVPSDHRRGGHLCACIMEELERIECTTTPALAACSSPPCVASLLTIVLWAAEHAPRVDARSTIQPSEAYPSSTPVRKNQPAYSS